MPLPYLAARIKARSAGEMARLYRLGSNGRIPSDEMTMR
jgi:hypothetical protein